MSSVPNDLESAANGTSGAQPAWKRELNDKIAAARAKRQAGQEVPAQGTAQDGPGIRGEVLKPGEADSRASRVAAAVAARYAQAPSYSEYLASEVRAAVMAAAVAQEVADEARAMAETQQARAAAVLSLASKAQAQVEQVRVDSMPSAPSSPMLSAPSVASELKPAVTAPAARVDYAASGIPVRSVQSYSANSSNDSRPTHAPPPSAIGDPLAEALITPATPLPAKLLEFPRELIAARKARPRHAEGPLRDEGNQPQLRIFEVEPEAISTAVETPPQATEWSSIRLDAHPPAYHPVEPLDEAAQPSADAVSSTYARGQYSASPATSRHTDSGRTAERSYQAQASTLVRVASLEDRLMAGIVDAALVGIAFLLFAFVFTASAVHPPTGKPAMIGSAIVLAAFYLLYQFLFFTFADGTPGMLYARIALCTFDDDNPTRPAMRKRIFALILAAMPLGLGFLYAIFDEEHLGWHDRMTRMYQRSYK